MRINYYFINYVVLFVFMLQASNVRGQSIPRTTSKMVPTVNLISTQPDGNDKSYCPSDNVTTLSVVPNVAYNYGLYSYQWYYNASKTTVGATKITGAINSTYTPSSANGNVYYYCQVSWVDNMTLTKPSTSRITVPTSPENSSWSGKITFNTAPTITSQPASIITWHPGEYSAKVSIAASNQTAIKWYKNSIASNVNGTFTGVTGNDFYFTNYFDNGVEGPRYFYAVVEGTCGNVPSNLVTVNVTFENLISTQPSTTLQPICLNGTSTPLEVTLDNTKSGFYTVNYQWYKNSTSSNTGGTLITNATSSTYTPTTDVVGTTYYYCELTKTFSYVTKMANTKKGLPNNSKEVSAVSGAVTVKAKTAIATDIANLNQSYPYMQTPSAMSIVASGTGLSYQWYKSTSNDYVGSPILSATSASYTPTNEFYNNTSYYYCIVQGDCGEAKSSIAKVETTFPITLVTQINSDPQTTCPNVVFTNNLVYKASTTVTNYAISYQWYRNSTNSTTGGVLVGSNSDTYTPSTADQDSEYYYYCVAKFVSNLPKMVSSPSLTSNVSGLHKVKPLVAIAPVTVSNQDVKQNQSTSVYGINALNAVSYQWYENVVNSNTGGTAITGANTNSFQPLSNVLGKKYYYCVATDACNTTKTSDVVGYVNVTPNVGVTDPTPATNKVCKDADLSVSVTGTGDNLTYQWYANATDANTGGTPVSGATTAVLNVPTNVVGKTYYYCVVTSSLICKNCKKLPDNVAVSKTTVVEVQPNLQITKQPLADAQTIYEYETVDAKELKVEATGVNLSYQWYKTSGDFTNWTPMSGYILDHMLPYETAVGQYKYKCKVTSDCGVMDTDPSGIVKVIPLVNLISGPSADDKQYCQGAEATTLTVDVEGKELHYQWYYNTTNSNVGGTMIPGANQASYTPQTTADFIGDYYYYCKIISGFTCKMCKTLDATTAVSGKITVYKSISFDNLVSDREKDEVCFNSSAKLTASGEYLGEIVWESSPNLSDFQAIPGATAFEYVAPNIISDTYFRVKLTNGVCEKYSEPILIKVEKNVPEFAPIADIYEEVTAGCAKKIDTPVPDIDDDCSPIYLSWTMTGATNDNSNTGKGVQVLGSYIGEHVFNIGVTNVTYTATDEAGNKTEVSFKVTVSDKLPPIVNVKPLTVTLDDKGYMNITKESFEMEVKDNCDIKSIEISKSSISCEDEGEISINIVVTDKYDNVTVKPVTVLVVNPFGDNDKDNIKDNCDDDDDNDGVKDVNDNCPLIANTDQKNNDNDQWGDACDDDDDNDGILDVHDNCPLTYNPDQADIDKDGIGDVCDLVEINVPEAFTPNGDGINDTWTIVNIKNYPKSVVRVFNRWGSEVFSATNYQNDWAGYFKNNKEPLPDAGSYYYQIDLEGDGSIEKEGWLFIKH